MKRGRLVGSSIFKRGFKKQVLAFLRKEQAGLLREDSEDKWFRVYTLEYVIGRIEDEDFG